MCGMQETLDSLFPTSWLDPYGNMPLNKQYSVQIDITQVETDNGIKVTAVKTPPQAGTTSIQDAINMALGMSCCDQPCEDSKSKEQKKPESKEDAGKDGEDAEKEEKPEEDGEEEGHKYPFDKKR